MDILNPDYLLSLLVSFVTSWQVAVIFGLIVLDLLLGVASALKTGTFELGKLADFYKTNVIPYLLGYLAFYIVIGYIIPPDSLGDIGEPVNEAAVTLTWITLVASLVSSIAANFKALYQTEA
jgi:hypothetical protein